MPSRRKKDKKSEPKGHALLVDTMIALRQLAALKHYQQVMELLFRLHDASSGPVDSSLVLSPSTPFNLRQQAKSLIAQIKRWIDRESHERGIELNPELRTSANGGSANGGSA